MKWMIFFGNMYILFLMRLISIGVLYENDAHFDERTSPMFNITGADVMRSRNQYN